MLDELPPGRTPINTVLVSDSRRDEVVERVRAGCAEGRQAYWSMHADPGIRAAQAQAAEVTWLTLCEQLPDLSIGLIHSRMKPAEKAEIMQSFKDG